jgi:hypothetical protein
MMRSWIVYLEANLRESFLCSLKLYAQIGQRKFQSSQNAKPMSLLEKLYISVLIQSPQYPLVENIAATYPISKYLRRDLLNLKPE